MNCFGPNIGVDTRITFTATLEAKEIRVLGTHASAVDERLRVLLSPERPPRTLIGENPPRRRRREAPSADMARLVGFTQRRHVPPLFPRTQYRHMRVIPQPFSGGRHVQQLPIAPISVSTFVFSAKRPIRMIRESRIVSTPSRTDRPAAFVGLKELYGGHRLPPRTDTAVSRARLKRSSVDCSPFPPRETGRVMTASVNSLRHSRNRPFSSSVSTIRSRK